MGGLASITAKQVNDGVDELGSLPIEYGVVTLPDGTKVEFSSKLMEEIERQATSAQERYCFLTDTQISIWDGTTKPIEEVRPSDMRDGLGEPPMTVGALPAPLSALGAVPTYS